MHSTALTKLLAAHPRLHKVGPNPLGKDYFCGDLHGQYSPLKRALKKAQFDPAVDRLFCTGNLINYGPQSLELLKLLEQPWFYSVLGIHELMMQEAIHSQHFLHWHTNGGSWAFDDKMQLAGNVQKLAHLVGKLPVAIELTHKKHGIFGLLSAAPGKMQDWQQLEFLTNDQLLPMLNDTTPCHRKLPPLSGLDCLVVGNQSAQKVWCRGNLVGINLGARYLPEKGQLALLKSKRLLKTFDKKQRFLALNR